MKGSKYDQLLNKTVGTLTPTERVFGSFLKCTCQCGKTLVLPGSKISSYECSCQKRAGVLVNGKFSTIKALCDSGECKVKYSTVMNRIKRGIPVEEAINQQSQRKAKFYEVNGENLTLREIATKYGLSIIGVKHRLEKGIPLDAPKTKGRKTGSTNAPKAEKPKPVKAAKAEKAPKKEVKRAKPKMKKKGK